MLQIFVYDSQHLQIQVRIRNLIINDNEIDIQYEMQSQQIILQHP